MSKLGSDGAEELGKYRGSELGRECCGQAAGGSEIGARKRGKERAKELGRNRGRKLGWDGRRDRARRERATERVRVDRTVEGTQGRARASVGAREEAKKEQASKN